MSIRNSFSPEICLNPSLRGLGQSATLAINERSNRLRDEGEVVFKLGLGQSPFPVPDPVVEALRANAGRKEYLSVQGLKALRAAVADYHRRSQGVAAKTEGVIVGPGSKELMFLLLVVFSGDVVIPTPAWVSYAPQAQIVGRKIYFIHTNAAGHWHVDPDQIERLCKENGRRPRILVLNYPSNPTGTTYDRSELQALARVARDCHLVILSDEIYGELHHEGKHASIAQYYPEGTILSGGLSKWCGAGGWRLGTFTFPAALGWLRDAMCVVASETYTSTSAPIQYAAVRAFQGSMRIERYLWQARRILGALGKEIYNRLRKIGLYVEPPTGAFYVFPDFAPFAGGLRERGITTSRELCERLLEETGVAIIPGVDFGRPLEELTARIAYVDFDGTRALAAAETFSHGAPLDDDFLAIYASDVLTAIERLSAWLAEGKTFNAPS